MVQVSDLNLDCREVEYIANSDVLVDVGFCQRQSIMSGTSLSCLSASNIISLSLICPKKEYYPASVFLCFKFVWILAACSIDINCPATVEYIINMRTTYNFCVVFSFIFLVVWKV